MKKLLLFLLFTFHISHFTIHCLAQDQHLIDSLETQLKHLNTTRMELGNHSPTMNDSLKVKVLNALSQAYLGSNPDKAMDYAKQTLALSEQIGYKKGMGAAYFTMGVVYLRIGDYSHAMEFQKKALEIRLKLGYKIDIAASYGTIGIIYNSQGNYPEGLKNFFAALKICEEIGYKRGIATSYANIGTLYYDQHNLTEAMKNISAALKIQEELGNKSGIANSYTNIGSIYGVQHNYTEALKNYSAALKINEEIGDKYQIATTICYIGDVNKGQGNYPEALKNYITALKIQEEIGDENGIARAYYCIGMIYRVQKKYNESYQYLNKGLSLEKKIGNLENIKDIDVEFASLDSAQGNFKRALEHYKLFIINRDSLVNKENTKKITQQQMQFDFDKKQVADSLKFEKEKEVGAILLQRQKAMTWTGFAGVALTLMFLSFMYRGFRKQKRSNRIIEQTNGELHKVNNELKDTQAQLVQQEKLASLGALTAGIAHEIKNPLNFVNNFAELSNELLEELKTAGSEEEKNEIMETLKQNLEKINHHGKRADGIVKSMLEHSRSGTGEKQPTDINRLCDEYLNLAYHGMRASVKDFNCTMERHFAENLPKLNIVPQDISRVLLNLINNAFYAIKDKPNATLTITTMATITSLIIKIKDNGSGIPENIKQKIFEPFFTTKPAGSGTGLGLSLSFDIIKAHGGKIEVNSKENEFTEFLITLPI